ncbi:hypothetical protein RHMOL_Rhmol11G0275500 [Rhododendron molle]|uniref:Uncharacterized protein n=1 Tax=Rhododendron molle TaxID=49168 RepID=A0ACC0LXS5_RHOML|nr:hypothetical protein RHMOL_Rhmol11G0275500 [Rhododendron molle]
MHPTGSPDPIRSQTRFSYRLNVIFGTYLLGNIPRARTTEKPICAVIHWQRPLSVNRLALFPLQLFFLFCLLFFMKTM